MLSPFGLMGDEPFIMVLGYYGAETLGVREALARGALTPDQAKKHYPQWDQVLSEREVKWGKENPLTDEIACT